MIKELYDRTLGMIEGQTIDTDGKFDTLDGLPSNVRNENLRASYCGFCYGMYSGRRR